MLSYGAVALQIPSAQEAAFIGSKIPAQEAFGFFRPKDLGHPDLNPRSQLDWFLSRPFKLNSLFYPWGCSRWGYAFVLADHNMMEAIDAQNSDGSALPFKIDDGVGNSIQTDLFMLPPVPLSKINVLPSLPLFLIPLVDERYRLWERDGGDSIAVEEGTTTWTDLYGALESALDIDLTVDPIPSAYLKPGAGLGATHQPLPLLLDWCAASVGQRIVRRLDGTYKALNPSTASALMIAQVNQYKKYAGGTLPLGVVDG